MKTKTVVPLLWVALLLVACQTLPTYVVTITQVRDSAMKDWAAASVAGKTSPAIDAAVFKADSVYRQSAGVAEKALTAYKASGNPSDYTSSLQAVKVAVQAILDVLTPILAPADNATLKANLAKASKL